MNLGLDDDRRALRESARSILAAECAPAVTREVYDDPTQWATTWKTIVDLGWTAVLEAGGRDDVLDLAVLLEQAGAATVPAPLVSSTGLAAGALRAVGAPGADIVTELADGAVGALATGPGVGPAPQLAVADGRVTGRLDQVRDAERADLIVVLAREADGTDCIAVVRRGSGVHVTPATSVDPSAPVAAIDIDTAAEVAMPVPIRQALAVPLVAAAAELVGVADRALSMSVEHAKTRRQFGQPIGAFQAVKHRLADCYVSLERARSLTYLAATLCTAARISDGETWRTAVLAKAAANDAATAASRATVAVHGAIAQTWEHDAHLLLRRAWLGSALLGDSDTLYAEAARCYTEVVA